MRRLLLLPLLFMPLFAGAAVYPDVQASTSSAEVSSTTNTYTAGSQVTVVDPLPADLITAGATVTVSAPVAGDILAVGGTVAVLSGAGGDVRVAGGRVNVTGPVGGDIAAAGGSVHINSSATNIYAAGGSVEVLGSSTGDVTIYGANVLLSGEYTGDVSVVASNRFTVGEGTHIHGTLKYSAPEELALPAGTQVDGGAKYTGAYAYVPTSRQVHQYALLGTAIFFAVRLLAGMIVAGLVAGLFPLFSERVASLMLKRKPRRVLSLFGIGVCLTVLTPILCLLLLISFVGAELALVLVVLYALLALIAYAFCGITIGVLLRRTLLMRLTNDPEFTWKDAALGTVVVHFVGLIPVIGTGVIFLLAVVCAGALARFAYHQIFTYRISTST